MLLCSVLETLGNYLLLARIGEAEKKVNNYLEKTNHCLRKCVNRNHRLCTKHLGRLIFHLTPHKFLCLSSAQTSHSKLNIYNPTMVSSTATGCLPRIPPMDEAPSTRGRQGKQMIPNITLKPRPRMQSAHRTTQATTSQRTRSRRFLTAVISSRHAKRAAYLLYSSSEQS